MKKSLLIMAMVGLISWFPMLANAGWFDTFFGYLQHPSDTIEPTPGPAGAKGGTGDTGPPGECECPITQEQLVEIYDRIEYLESLVPRFTDLGNGTVRDNDTGLIWLKDASCSDLPGTDSSGTANWWDAQAAAAALANGTCGLRDGSAAGDWRQPTKAEWEAFYSLNYIEPALVNTVGAAQWSEGDAFTGVQSYYSGVQSYYYWSSTGYAGDPFFAWYVGMGPGYVDVNNKDHGLYVWPVRSDN